MYAADKIAAIIQQLPSVTQEVKWEVNECFLIAGKIFAVRSLVEDFAFSMKVTEEDFYELTERDGVFQAPYFKRNQWIKISLPNALSTAEWQQYLGRAYQLVFQKLTKKQREEILGGFE
jgi:predicted DNA-binding protein (MmcQ/YjbR family)